MANQWSTTEGLVTVEEFERISAAHPDRMLELINGKIVEKKTTQEHNLIAINIGMELKAFVLPHHLGRVEMEVSHRLSDDRVNKRLPDVAVVLDTPDGSELPALAVEIKSSDDSYAEMREKAEYYLNNGTRLVWLVYPNKSAVEVYHLDENSDLVWRTLTENDTLNGIDVLPGFELPVIEVFNFGKQSLI